MHRIVVQCEEQGCIKAPRWALIGKGNVRIVRSCDPHLAKVARRRLRLSSAQDTIEIQEV